MGRALQGCRRGLKAGLSRCSGRVPRQGMQAGGAGGVERQGIAGPWGKMQGLWCRQCAQAVRGVRMPM